MALRARIRDVALLGMLGPSGVGESSLLRAGLVPALRSSREPWEALVFGPGRCPVQALANLCAPLLGPNTSLNPDPANEASLRTRIVSEPGYLGTVLRNHCRRLGTRPLVMVDQFEELYTLGAEHPERHAFTSGLAGAADDPTSPVRVVVSMRSDFLGRAAEDPDFLGELTKGLFFLGPPSKLGLREALVQSAEMVGSRFESERIVDEMVHFLKATPNGLPLLQFSAAQLWETRDPLRHLLTEQSYRGMGGVSGSLVTHADRVYSRFQPELQALCRGMLIHLVTPERTRAVRTMGELHELTGERERLERLVGRPVDSRLLIEQTTMPSSRRRHWRVSWKRSGIRTGGVALTSGITLFYLNRAEPKRFDPTLRTVVSESAFVAPALGPQTAGFVGGSSFWGDLHMAISPLHPVRFLATLLALAVFANLELQGCGETEAVVCDSGVLCPARTRCTEEGDSCVPEGTDCGDGRLQAGELCDDGNHQDGDGCSADCVIERCGDGEVQRGAPRYEECDLGEENNIDTGA